MGHDKERTGCLGCGSKYYIVQPLKHPVFGKEQR